MTTHMFDLFPAAQYGDAIADGLIRVQRHPNLPLSIANYTEKTQYAGAWNAATLACRGLIVDDAGHVVARPYRKFFNYGDEANTGPLDMAAPVVVTDKLDGSLGISYPTPDGPAIATRGSFTSDQAIHATELLRSKYPLWQPIDGYTYLFEIVYPENRIVVDYGDTDDLILHGAVNIETGKFLPTWEAALSWPGPDAGLFTYGTLAAALAAEPRPNAEGLVVRYILTGLMVKLKQADYVALHRIITGLNARSVWEWLGDGKTVGDLCATLPDDFHQWVEDVAAELHRDVDHILRTATRAHAAVVRLLERSYGTDWTRRQYAHLAAGWTVSRPYMFMLLDGKDDAAKAAAWRAVKPAGNRTLVNTGEVAA